jgi:hypothetical protein
MSENLRSWGRRFCATCEHPKPLDGGKMIDPRHNRWKCADCINNPRIRDVSEQKDVGDGEDDSVPAL